MNANRILSASAVLLGLGVMLGAFGAHALEDSVTAKALETWETAVLYHFVHGLALLFCGLALKQDPSNGKRIRISAAFFFVGMIIFSGSLYALVLTDTPVLGAITPIGGISFIIGWFLLAYHYIKNEDAKKQDPL